MESNILQEHIHISYLCNNNINEHFLTEEHGYVPYLDDYVRCFKAALPEKFTSGKVFSIDDEAFKSIPDRFFRNMFIQVGVTFVADAHEYPRGRYSPDRAFLRNGKFWNPVITILFVTGSGATIVDQLAEAFSHELTHCYEDYQRALKGKDSLDIEYDKRKYGEISKIDKDAKFSEKFLKGILYFFNKIEQNAYIGELKAIFQSKSADELKNSENVMKVLEGSEFYINYNIIRSRIDRLRADDFKPATRDNMVKKFQEIYSNNTRVRNFHDLSKLLLSRWNKWDRKFKSTLGKIAYDVYLDKEKGTKAYSNPTLTKTFGNYWTNVDEEQ